MAWTNLTFTFGQVLTSTQMTQLDDNFEAMSNGDSGAPSVRWYLLSTTTPTAVTAIDFTWDESLYSEILLIGEGMTVGTNNADLSLRFGYNNGGTIITSAVYAFPSLTYNTEISVIEGIGNDVEEGFSFTLKMTGMSSIISPPMVDGGAAYVNTTGVPVASIGIEYAGIKDYMTTQFDTARIFLDTGNFGTTGKLYLYGLKNA